MSVRELISKRRTIRRFQQQPIGLEACHQIVDAGRLAPSASNLQPLEFLVIEQPDLCSFLFSHTRWAGYLPADQGRPGPDQAPVAYVLILVNKNVRTDGFGSDVGAAAENMILSALELGIGTCWIGSISDRSAVKKQLRIPEHFELDSLLALGFPAEEPMAEPLNDSVKYYRDEQGRLHVPKRTLASVLHVNGF